MADKNEEVLLKCKLCGNSARAKEMRLSKSGKDLLCPSCSKREDTRKTAMRNVKIL